MFEHDLFGESIGIFNPKWKDETIQKYIESCNNHLFRHLPDFQPIEVYTVEELDLVIDTIQILGGLSESTMNVYRLLIWRIFNIGHQKGYCEDILWGTHYQNSIDGEDQRDVKQSEAILKLRKSLTKAEEKYILEKLEENPALLTGQEIGIYIMALTGMRNNEVCGLDFGDLRPL